MFTSVNTVVDSIALGPADGASFCPFPELPALHIRKVLRPSPRSLFQDSTALEAIVDCLTRVHSRCRLVRLTVPSVHLTAGFVELTKERF